jgi:RecA/RadA recombinase
MGKTTLALQLAAAAAKEVPVMVVTFGVCPTFYTAFCHDCEHLSLTC